MGKTPKNRFKNGTVLFTSGLATSPVMSPMPSPLAVPKSSPKNVKLGSKSLKGTEQEEEEEEGWVMLPMPSDQAWKPSWSKPDAVAPGSPTVAKVSLSSGIPPSPSNMWRRKNHLEMLLEAGALGGRTVLQRAIEYMGPAGVSLGMSSRKLKEFILASDPDMTSLWHAMGWRAAASATATSAQAPIFGDDIEFLPQRWACLCSFVMKIASGTVQPMEIATLPDLEFSLGPYMGASALVVSDGGQSFRVVDVKRLRREMVPVDRFREEALVSSMGIHPDAVTSSWPLQGCQQCCAGGGVLVSTPPKSGATATAAFSWLQLPTFEGTLQQTLRRLTVSQERMAKTLESTDEMHIESMWALGETRGLLLMKEAGPTGPSARQWLQVWELDPTSKDASKACSPLGSVQVSSYVTEVLIERDGIFVGYGSGVVELRSVSQDGRINEPSVMWHGTAGQPVRFMLTRKVDDSEKPTVIIAHSDSVMAFDKSEGCHTLLPSVRCAKAMRVSALQPVGSRGFAVCTDAHVYAFQMRVGGMPEMAATICLPVTGTCPAGAPVVKYFAASLYGFTVLLHEDAVSSAQDNAIYCLWSRSKLTGQHVISLQQLMPNQNWRKEPTSAICLNALLTNAKLDRRPISALAVHESSGLLALSAQSGTLVVGWGIEASEKYPMLRKLQKEHQKEVAKQEKNDALKRDLVKVEKKLADIDRIEKKIQEKGLESLEPAEDTKRQRRTELEEERAKISTKLYGYTKTPKSQCSDEPDAEQLAELRREERRRERDGKRAAYESASRDRIKDRGQQRDNKRGGYA